MAKREIKITLCTFCLKSFTPDLIWVVDLKMHRDDPDRDSMYSIPACGPCKDHKDNSWRIVGISMEPKIKKPTKKQNEKDILKQK